MKTLSVTLAIMLAVVSADVSHLTSHYLPPNYQMQNNQHRQQHGPAMMMPNNQHPSNGRVETTIEKHEVIELPTQVEIVKEGQPIYGVHQQPIEMARVSNNNINAGVERMPEINARYLPPNQEISNLQPPQVPYEMPMREYLPPVEKESTTTTDVPPTTSTMMPPTTTYNPIMSYEAGETTTEQQLSPEEMNNYNNAMTTEMPTQDPAYETTTTNGIPYEMPENHYLPPMPMPQNNYLPPPISMTMMLPPPEPMPQMTYQQYQEKMMQEQQMQQMYHEQEMKEMMEAIAEMEQQQMIALEPQQQQQQQPMQPIAPVEPAHILRDDGYHYKTAADDVRRYRYRH